MRIIDKNNDYYDYLQDREDTLVFDRRGSFLLTKEKMCKEIAWSTWRENASYRFVLMQSGATFWLFLVHITKFSDYPYHKPLDYDIELLTSWKDYTIQRELLKLSLIIFTEDWKYEIYDWMRLHDYNRDKILSAKDVLQAAIIHGGYKVVNNIAKNTKYVGETKEEQTIPLLKACGISNIVSAEDMYHAIDEYFSLEKTAAESTVAEGTTNTDKILNHGFDTKTSFRGK